MPLSEQGFSLRDMEERTGIAKTTIQEVMQHLPRLMKKKSGYAPYGYIYFDGKLIIDPKEKLILRKILKLNEVENNYQNVADEFNIRKIKTRFGKQLGKGTIRSLVLREKARFS